MEAINKTDWLTDFVGAEAAGTGKAFELLEIKFEDCLQEDDLEKNSLAFVGNSEGGRAHHYQMSYCFDAGYYADPAKGTKVVEQMKDYFVKKYNLKID